MNIALALLVAGQLGYGYGYNFQQPKILEAASYASTKAFEFNGTDERVNLGDITTADGASRLKIAFWIKWPAGAQGWVIARRDTSQRQFAVFIVSTGQIRFYAASNLTTDGFVASNTNLTADTWTHVALDFGDPSNPTDNASIAIDGVDDGGLAGSLASVSALPAPTVATSMYLADAALTDPIAMQLAHPAIWVGANAAAVDVSEVYASASDPRTAPNLNSLATTPPPDHWWPADSADPTTAGGVVDLGTGGANGTAENMDDTDIVDITGAVADAGVPDSGVWPDAEADAGPSDTGIWPDAATDAGTALAAYATYLDSNSGETTVRDVAWDSSGSMIAAGGTAAAGLTDRATGYQATGSFSGTHAAWVGKWSLDGTTQWLVQLSGSGYDRAYAVEVDGSDDVYVGGRAGPGFPTTSGVAQETFAGDNTPNPAYGGQDGFVCKLSGVDGSVVWCTYLGDDEYAFIRDIAVDSSGRVHAGISQVSGTFAHTTVGAFDTSLSGEDAAIVRLSADGTTVDWGTYLGGTGDDGTNPTVRVTATGVFVATHGTSTSYPTTGGAFTTAAEATSSCAGLNIALTSLSLDGSTNNWSTYVCGSGDQGNETHGLEVDGDNVFLTGFTASSVLNAGTLALAGWMPAAPGNVDLFVARFDRATGAAEAFSYYGHAAAGDSPEGVAVDGTGRLFVGGLGQSGSPVSEYVGNLAGGGLDSLLLTWGADLATLQYAALIGADTTTEQIRSLSIRDGRLAYGALAAASGWPGASGSLSADGGVSRAAVPGWYTIAALDGGTPPVGDAGVPDTGPDSGIWPDASVDAGFLAYEQDMEGTGCTTPDPVTGTNNLDCDQTTVVLEGSESAARPDTVDDLNAWYLLDAGLSVEAFVGVLWQTGAGSSLNYGSISLHEDVLPAPGTPDYTTVVVQVRVDSSGEIEVRCFDGTQSQTTSVYAAAFTPGTAFALKGHYVVDTGSGATFEAFVGGVSLGTTNCGSGARTVQGYVLGLYSSRVNYLDNIQITASESAPGWDY